MFTLIIGPPYLDNYNHSYFSFPKISQGYCGKEFPGPLIPPMFLIDKFFNPMKYGLFFFFICEKPSQNIRK